MPKIVVEIEWDLPDEPFWLNPDNVAVALHDYCENTHFIVTSAKHTLAVDSATPQVAFQYPPSDRVR